MKTILTDLEPDEFAARVAAFGCDARQARRIYAHVAGRGRRDLEVRDVARHKLARIEGTFALPTLEVTERRRAADGFVKYLFRLHDGAQVEAVRIPLFDEKYTVCISSQAGCALACAFCATGRLGFQRNLATWEIVEQVRARLRDLPPTRELLYGFTGVRPEPERSDG